METEKRRQLTNEQLSKRFRSQFDLVNHAIRMAGHLILSGHAPGPGSSDNLIDDVLTDIKLGRDAYMDFEEEEESEEELDEVEIFSSRDLVEDEAVPTKKKRARTLPKK